MHFEPLSVLRQGMPCWAQLLCWVLGCWLRTRVELRCVLAGSPARSNPPWRHCSDQWGLQD
jgi:hypothetical protein